MAWLGAKVSRSEVSSFPKNTFSVGIFWQNLSQFYLKSPLEFVFPKNTFSVWIFVVNRNSPILWAKRTRWHDWGQKCPAEKFHPSLKTRFRSEFFDETGAIPLFWAELAIWCVQGQNCSGRKLCSILPQKPSRIRFSKKHVFGLNFCPKSHLTDFMVQTD